MSFMQTHVDGEWFRERITGVLGIEAQTDYESGKPRYDERTNLPLWNLEVVFKPDFGRKEVLNVGFAAQQPPTVVPGQVPVFEALRCRPYANIKQAPPNSRKAPTMSAGLIWECDQVSFGTTNGRGHPTATDRAAKTTETTTTAAA